MAAKRLTIVVVVLLAMGGTACPATNAAPAGALGTNPAVAVRDVTLHDGGVLVGQMLDGQGVGIANATVSVGKAGKEVARVITGKEGKFKIDNLTGGVHQVAAAGQVGVYRFWAPQTAPPAAQQGLMLVTGTDVVRGQCGCGTPVCGSPVCGNGCCPGGAYGRGACGGGIGTWMANHPILTAGGIAAAIAIPLAVDDDDSPATP